ncbi:S-layer homology domain-containing protein [Petrocella sp. FN5]|uniref:S-layer homology domain-containing protein n=1 Tax=Petrocella sp. FN5 TaxID=3032002 RepID=UPI0023DB616F|nr:S-layer homology domain-containing protein [Petrocella sp. FN5]MDF1617298.1 S-layer homology domain-containing protein [Petrocella sp. FN5]
MFDHMIDNPPMKSGPWYQRYVSYAEEKGLVVSGEFKSADYNRNITRGEMSRIIYRGLVANGEKITEDNKDKYIAKIKDYHSTHASMQDFILKSFQTGIMTGYPDGTFGAGKNATRAEASIMIHRLIDPSIRPKVDLTSEVSINRNGTFLDHKGVPLTFNGDPLIIKEPTAIEFYNKTMKLIDGNKDYNFVVKSYLNYTKLSFLPPGSDNLRNYSIMVTFHHNPSGGYVERPYYIDYNRDSPQNREILKQLLSVFFPTKTQQVYDLMMEVDGYNAFVKREGTLDGRKYFIRDNQFEGVVNYIYKK